MKLSDLLQNPLNRKIDRAKVANIKRAIETSGVIKPLVYTEVMTDKGKENMLTDGHHRYIALKEMGYKDAPVVMSDERGIETAQFQDMKTVKKALTALRTLAKYIDKHGSHDQQDHDPTRGRGGKKTRGVSLEGIRPAIIDTGRLFVGEKGKAHLDVYETNKNKFRNLASLRTGFVDKDGKWLSREDLNRLIETTTTEGLERVRARESKKFTKHGSHNQQDHNPTQGAAQGEASREARTRFRSSGKVKELRRELQSLASDPNKPGNKDRMNDIQNELARQASEARREIRQEMPVKDRDKEHKRKVLKNVARLRDILSKINRLTKEGVSATSVSGLELTREDLQGEMSHPHPGHVKKLKKPKKGWTTQDSFSLSEKMDMDEGVDTKHPYKNPEGAQVEGGRVSF